MTSQQMARELRIREYAYRVFGSALLSPDCAERLAAVPDEIIPNGMLRKEFLPAIRNCIAEGTKVTPDVVCAAVAGKVVDPEGVVYEMVSSVDSPETQEYYLTILRDWAVLKRFQRIIGKIESDGGMPLEIMSREVERAAGLYHGAGGARRLVDAAEGLAEVNTPATLSTGTPVDDIVAIKPGHLVFLAGTPGMGKTSLAVQMADLAASDGLTVLFVSLEMSAEEIAIRLCSRHGLTRVDAMKEYIASLPIYYECATTPSGIRMVAKSLNPDVIILDYIGLMSTDAAGKNTSRVNELAEISRSLKVMARTLRCPVIALSQLNRKAAEGTPQLHHLRDSGALEADADAVILIRQEETGRVLTVAKNRHGPVGEFPVEFDAASCTWR